VAGYLILLPPARRLTFSLFILKADMNEQTDMLPISSVGQAVLPKKPFQLTW